VCDVIAWCDIDDQRTFLAGRAADVQAVVTVSTLPFPGRLDDYRSLGLLAFYGAGWSTPEAHACLRKGVAVSHGPGTNSLDVADLAIGLMIAAVRRIAVGDRLVRGGSWTDMLPVAITPSLRDLRYGIVGLGAIGAAIADRLAVFGNRIMWWGPNPKPDARFPRAPSLIDLAHTSDVLIIAARGDEKARHIVNAEILQALGPEGHIVNVSRGHVIDEDALIHALSDRRLAGAGLDVFALEPTDPSRWAGLGNVVLTPHIGGWARASEADAQRLLAENLRRHFAGQPLLTPVQA
jgi:phosphoglycerate dehydrogenase-like enzyme